jgi:transposase-like protein
MDKKYVKRYSENCKLQVVREYEAGASVSSLQKKYGINGTATIKRWVKQYGRESYRSETVYINNQADHQAQQDLKKRVSALEKALAEAVLENRLLESTLAVASKALDLDLKKTFGKPS